MKRYTIAIIPFCMCFIFMVNCSANNASTIVVDDEVLTENQEEEEEEEVEETEKKTPLKILSLGDSYTIGQSVCDSCRFPEQLKDSINKSESFEITLQVIAQTGWTTTNLIENIEKSTIENDQDLVTLLIGVNNQYRRKAFSIFETEFPQLVNTAIAFSKGNKDNLIVISIPDYAFTPFGKGSESVTEDITKYNNFIKDYCAKTDISYVFITDITRLGLSNPSLVASDGLHPSQIAYSKFVERILPLAREKIE